MRLDEERLKHQAPDPPYYGGGRSAIRDFSHIRSESMKKNKICFCCATHTSVSDDASQAGDQRPNGAGTLASTAHCSALYIARRFTLTRHLLYSCRKLVYKLEHVGHTRQDGVRPSHSRGARYMMHLNVRSNRIKSKSHF